jgi:hypothetical protein
MVQGSKVQRFRVQRFRVQRFRGSGFKGSEVQGSKVQRFRVQRFRGSRFKVKRDIRFKVRGWRLEATFGVGGLRLEVGGNIFQTGNNAIHFLPQTLSEALLQPQTEVLPKAKRSSNLLHCRVASNL